MARLSTRTMNEWKQWILWARTTELLSVMVWVLGLWLFPVLFCSSPLKCRVLIFTSFILFPLFSPVCLRLSVFCSSVPFPWVSWVWVSVVPRVPACITSSSLVCTLLSFCCSLFLNLFHTCCVFFFFFATCLYVSCILTFGLSISDLCWSSSLFVRPAWVSHVLVPFC